MPLPPLLRPCRAMLAATATIALLFAGAPAFAGIATAAQETLPAGSIALLSVGIADYAYLPKLNSAVQDAKALAAAFPDAKANLLVNADRATLLKGLRALAAEPVEWAIFAFAGSGTCVSGETLLAPSDAAPATDAGGKPSLSGALTAAEVRQVLATAKATNLLLLINACVCGPDLAPSDRPGTTLALAAGTGARSAFDGTGGKHSPFTDALLKALTDKPDTGTHGAIHPGELITKMEKALGGTASGLTVVLLRAGPVGSGVHPSER